MRNPAMGRPAASSVVHAGAGLAAGRGWVTGRPRSGWEIGQRSGWEIGFAASGWEIGFA